MDLNHVLKTLCLAPGIGEITDAADAAEELLTPFCVHVERDALGSVIGWRDEDSDLPLVLLEAHIDQIGMIVTGCDDRGFLRVAACGGVDNRILTAAEVTVFGDAVYSGVFCSVPPHLGGGDLPELCDRGIDVGMTADEVKAHIPVGSKVIYRASYDKLLGERVVATSLDDRAGVAVVLRCMELLKDEKLNCRVAAAFAVQEEIGVRGSAPVARCVNPSAAVITDVSFAVMPQEKPADCGELGKGPMIGVSPSLDMAYSRRLVELAKSANIPFQHEGMGDHTGTDADKIGTVGTGVRTALLSIPLRHMHTPVEVADLGDIENTARLMAEFVRNWEG